MRYFILAFLLIGFSSHAQPSISKQVIGPSGATFENGNNKLSYTPIVMDSEVNNGITWNGSLPYFIFIAFIVIIMVITYKYIPETKGKSLEEIEQFWEV